MPLPTSPGQATAATILSLPLNTPTAFPNDTRTVPGDVTVVVTSYGPNTQGNLGYALAIQPVVGGPTDLANQAAASTAASVATASANLTSVVTTLRTLATTASTTTATAGNVVAVTNGILSNIAILLNRLADLLVATGKGT